MKVMRLSGGYLTIVDDDIFELVGERSLTSADKHRRCNYARLHLHGNKYVYLHRLIIGAQPGQLVDHINRNTLDNRRANLRFATRQGNRVNATKQRGNYTSKYKGVHFNKRVNRWIAQVNISRNFIFGGTFRTEIEAARAYDVKALELFGEFAHLNLPEESTALAAPEAQSANHEPASAGVAVALAQVSDSADQLRVVAAEEGPAMPPGDGLLAQSSPVQSSPASTAKTGARGVAGCEGLPLPSPCSTQAERDAAPLIKPTYKDIRVGGISV